MEPEMESVEASKDHARLVVVKFFPEHPPGRRFLDYALAAHMARRSCACADRAHRPGANATPLLYGAAWGCESLHRQAATLSLEKLP